MTNNLQNVQLVFILFFQSPGSELRCNFLISRRSKSQGISSFAHTLWWTMRGIPERKKTGGGFTPSPPIVKKALVPYIGAVK